MNYTTGNLLESSATALVNTINFDGYMGKGIAYQFKQKFPENNKIYKGACKAQKLDVGQLLIHEEKGKIIVNFPTKKEWREKSQYNYIESGLLELKKFIQENELQSIAIPPLGCGNGGLDWTKVRTMISDQLKEIASNVEVIIYEPSAATHKSNIKKPPKLTASHLLLMGAKFKLKRFSKLRLQKTACLMNYLASDNYFRFEANKLGRYSQAVEIISRDIKQFQKLHSVETDKALLLARDQIISDSVQRTYNYYKPYLLQATELINSIGSNDKLELLTAILFLIQQNADIPEERIIEEIQNWSVEKAKKFSQISVQKMLEYLVKKNLVTQGLIGYSPNQRAKTNKKRRFGNSETSL